MKYNTSTSRKFQNPITGKNQKAAEGVTLYGFDETGRVIYAEATDKAGVIHLMGQIIDVKAYVRFNLAA